MIFYISVNINITHFCLYQIKKYNSIIYSDLTFFVFKSITLYNIKIARSETNMIRHNVSPFE